MAKKIPSAIDENSDSVLNESEVSSELNKLSIRMKHNGVERNGTDNLVFENEIVKSKQNLNSNGSTANSEVTTDDDDGIDIAPRKASSPLIKLNGNHLSLQNGRSNKVI